MPPTANCARAVTVSIFGVLLTLLSAGCGGEPFDPARIDEVADQLGLGGVVSVVAGEVATREADKANGSPATADNGNDVTPAAAQPSEEAEPATGEQAPAGDVQGDPVPPDGDEALADNPPGDSDAPAGGGKAPAHDTDEQPQELPQNDAPSVNGVYVLGLEGYSESGLDPYLNNPDVDGFSLRAGWAEVEPVEGVYDWSLFDAVIPYAADHGKKIMLRVIPGVRAPEWVYDAGAARFDFVDDNPEHATYGEMISMPLPWDAVFLEKWFDLVAVFGARYADNAAVTIVAIAGPAAGAEMHLGDKNNADRWHALGYSNNLMIETWKLTVDAFGAAFPNQHRTLAVANPVQFDAPLQIPLAVSDYCGQTGCGIQGNWLAAKTPPTYPLYQLVASQAAVAPAGFQMLCSAQQERFGGPLLTAIDLALDAGASFLEIYRPDIAQYPAEIAYAHQQLDLVGPE